MSASLPFEVKVGSNHNVRQRAGLLAGDRAGL